MITQTVQMKESNNDTDSTDEATVMMIQTVQMKEQ